MTIEPDWLRAAIALMLGRKPGKARLHDLARLLEQREEVLPWLMLRQGALADDADVKARLGALAATRNRPSHRRPAGLVVADGHHGLQRDAERALGALIAHDSAGAGLADRLGATLHAVNTTLPGRPGYDFRRRIAESARAPVAEQDANNGTCAELLPVSTGENTGQ